MKPFHLWSNLADAANSTDVDQHTYQETLENLVQAFQKVMDIQSKVRTTKLTCGYLFPKRNSLALIDRDAKMSPFLFVNTLLGRGAKYRVLLSRPVESP